jgi:hypothetical protein
MNDLNSDTSLYASQVQIRVSGCAKWVSNDQEAGVMSFGFFDHDFTSAFDEFSISQNDFSFIKSL